MLLTNRFIRMKCNKGLLMTGDEGMIVKQMKEEGGPYYVSTDDKRCEWVTKKDFILIEKRSLAINAVLKEPFFHYLLKHHFDIFFGSGVLVQNAENKIVILHDKATFYKWGGSISEGWHQTFQFTGLSNLDLNAFKLLMHAFDIIPKRALKTCVEIAEQNNNHTYY